MRSEFLFALVAVLIAGAAAQDAPPPLPAPAPIPSPPASPAAPSALAPASLSQEREDASARPIPADWPGTEYAEVRAYLYNPGEARPNLILNGGALHPEVVDSEGIRLDEAQVAQLLTTFRGKAANGTGVGCFEPHHGFVFYDREGQPVGDVTVCFLCIQGVTQPGPGSMTTWDLDSLKKLVQSLGLPVFKTFDESEAHFVSLAREWPDAKVKAKLDQYIFDESKKLSLGDSSRLALLQGLGERSHPVLLGYLSDKERRQEWLKSRETDSFPYTRFHRICEAFGDTPPAAVIPLLAGFIDEPDSAIRRHAVSTIAKTGAPEIVPFVHKAFADQDEYLGIYALEGLLAAINRGALHPATKAPLFEDVRALEPDREDTTRWIKILLGLDQEKAMSFLLSDETLHSSTRDIEAILDAFRELKVQVPRQHLLSLIETGQADEDSDGPFEAAFLLLGRQRHPDDLKLLQQMTTGEGYLAHRAMPGLLAWHGLEGYRKRLDKQEEEKGLAALSEAQRFHLAADDFASFTMNSAYYFIENDAEHWQTALAGLKAMKQDQMVAVLEEAAAAFGEDAKSTDSEIRWKRYRSIEDAPIFSQLGKRRQTLEDRCQLALDRYAIEHADDFK